MSYYVCFFDGEKTRVRLCANAATAGAWAKYLKRHGRAPAIVAVEMAGAIGVCARDEYKIAIEVVSHKEARAKERTDRIAAGWKPYLRGRFPQWVGLLAGFPLPGERVPR